VDWVVHWKLYRAHFNPSGALTMITAIHTGMDMVTIIMIITHMVIITIIIMVTNAVAVTIINTITVMITTMGTDIVARINMIDFQ
jgi:hypothetical protein